jgi:hypothetical protein
MPNSLAFPGFGIIRHTRFHREASYVLCQGLRLVYKTSVGVLFYASPTT